MRIKFKEHFFYILLLLILTVSFFILFLNNKMPFQDPLVFYYPLLESSKISFLEYNDPWPLWNPYGFSGTPFLMKPHLGLDSFFILGVLIHNTTIALRLSYVLAFFLSGISMYVFMNYLKIDKRFAFISALIYMLNGYVSSKLLSWGWLTSLGGYSVIPLVFLFGTKAIKEKEWIRNSIITGITFGIMLRLGPDMKVGLWIGLVFGLYLIFNLVVGFSNKKLIKYTLVSLLIVFVFFGLSAQRILPTKDYISKSARAQTDWKTASGRQLKLADVPKRLIEPGLPKINREGIGDHIGVIAFLLVCFAVFKRFKNKIVLFFTGTAILFILIANNTFGIYHFLWKYIPFLGSLRYMDRSLFVFAFSSSILAGIGASELFKKIKKNKNIFYISLVALILLNLWLFNYTHYGAKLREWRNPYDVIENNYILQYISKQPGLFRIQTWETHGIDFGTDFYNVPLKLEHIYRYDTIWYPPYMNVYLSVAYRDIPKFWGILNVKYITAITKLNVSGFKFIREFKKCNICYPETENWAKAYGPNLYENEKFLPRAFIVNNSILIVGEEDAAIQTTYGLMLDKNFNPANTVIIRGKQKINDYNIDELRKYKAIFLTKGSVDQNSGFILKNYIDSGGILLPDLIKNKNTVTEEDSQKMWDSLSGNLIAIPDEDIIMHNFDKREIKLNKNYKGFLVVSEKFSVFPGWKATINGNKKEILNADSIISSIYLNGNENNIIFEYKPKSYIIGSWITFSSIIILIALVIFSFLRKK